MSGVLGPGWRRCVGATPPGAPRYLRGCSTTGLRPSPTRHAVGHCRLKGKLTQGPAVRVANRHHSLRRWMLTATRRAYEQVRCAVVALWSERKQRYAAQTPPGKSNLTQSSRLRRPSPLDHSFPPQFGPLGSTRLWCAICGESVQQTRVPKLVSRADNTKNTPLSCVLKKAKESNRRLTDGVQKEGSETIAHGAGI